MQISFGFFYDEEFASFCEKLEISSYLSNFLILLPEVVLIIDTILKFFTGFYVNGIIIEDRKKILHHYIKTGIIFDIIAYFPVLFQGILKLQFSSTNHTIIKLLQLMMFCKLKRVSTALSNFEEMIASKGKHDYVLSSVRLILNLLFIAHLNACAWHAIAYFNTISETNWMKAIDILSFEWNLKYLICMYWSVGLLLNSFSQYNIAPQNQIEYIYLIFILVAAIWLFGFIIQGIREILEIKSKKSKEYK